MNQKLLLGDEAIAQAALDAGLSGVYAYPGTPSTEITEYIQGSPEARARYIHSDWACNEKTAMEAALGMAYAGKRTLVCMKHVGLNASADAFMNTAITGVNGGMIIVAADDPSMHSSQNEQDSRYYGKFAMLPVMEPSSQQEAYDMVWAGYELSERVKLPVLMRVTTRMAHSRTTIVQRPAIAPRTVSFPEDRRSFILLPVFARMQYKKLIAVQPELQAASTDMGFNRFLPGSDTSLGIITTGIGYNYLMENFPDGCPYPVVKIVQYPIPQAYISKLVGMCNRVLVIEEGMPFVEEQLKGLVPHPAFTVEGRLSGLLPRDGELSPYLVAKALGLNPVVTGSVPDVVVNRPPALCKGCGHQDMYNALNAVMAQYENGRVFGDIGCYTLGALPPFKAIDGCVDMGASVTMAKGASDAGVRPAVAVIGDSTFTHSGMTGLLDAVLEKTPMTVIISDNSTTAMTGGQDSHGYGILARICLGLGVEEEHLKVLVPLKKNHEENVRILAGEVAYEGLSVVIFQRECVQTAARRLRAEKQNKK
ncbi:MAG: indolepyruvate ferredoxin oxidoreductase [Bacteroidales bacterium]|nr:indolepyruvate ferredoxin oxidoreductase [Bacteroidales bacterium]